MTCYFRPWPTMTGRGWSFLVNGRSMVSQRPSEHSFSILMLDARKFDQKIRLWSMALRKRTMCGVRSSNRFIACHATPGGGQRSCSEHASRHVRRQQGAFLVGAKARCREAISRKTQIQHGEERWRWLHRRLRRFSKKRQTVNRLIACMLCCFEGPCSNFR